MSWSLLELTPCDCGDVAPELEKHGDCITGRVTGQFNTGFKDGSLYEYQVDGCDIEEIPSGLIYSPGTCAYEFYVKGSIYDVAGKTLKIYRDGKCIAEKCIDKVE
ncbi:hypothetical protein Glove_219g82 [Diversispora epigaea]|uniref:Uncharacterized protein n=1 Tax=Diversispora epigaea TaxID=1348612 RepID=A0A397IP81_9GLOM|nr:hypothetical protein Glove_219g82 [Diversispora epigaea]